MADDAGTAEEAPITFIVKTSTDKKYTMTLPLSTLVSDLKQKLETAEPDQSDKSDDSKSNIPADRQRLIYSGRILKDHETLGSYKIKDGHTIHMVGNANSNQNRNNNSTAQSSSTAASAGANPAASAAAAGVPTNLAAGTGNNPLAGLTGARYAGFAQLPGAGLFGPDGGMGPPPDTDTMLNMLDNPQFQSTLNEALQNPAMIDMMIQQNPLLRSMGPGARRIFEDPNFRRMITDPQQIRQTIQMQRMFGQGGGGGGDSPFPAPGVTNTTPGDNQNQDQQQNTPPNPFGQMPGGQAPGSNPFAALFGSNPFGNPFGQPPAAASTGNNQDQGNQSTDRATPAEGQNPEAAQNPFASLFNPAMFGNAGQSGQPGSANMNPFNPDHNPFLNDPAAMMRIMQGMGQGDGLRDPAAMARMMQAFGGGGDLGGFGSPQPPDNRAPEDRYADQLRQLNDMGFVEFERNIEALRRTGGSVQGAVEYLLGNPS